jgi:hypothetical protein
MKAQKFIYRNLTKACFSIRLRGKVIEHFTKPVVLVGSFKVNDAGREQVRRESKKYVHAFVTLPENHSIQEYDPALWAGWKKREVSYNPYVNETFVYKDTGEQCYGSIIVMDYPKVYVLERE